MKLPVPALVLFLVAAITSVTLSARPGFPGAMDRHGGLFFLEMMADRIGLTEDQEAAITELVNTFRLDSAVDRERMDQVRDELRSLGQADSFDRSAAENLAEELAELVARTAVSGSELHYEIRQVLTAEQREQLEGCHGARRGHRFDFDPQHPLTE